MRSIITTTTAFLAAWCFAFGTTSIVRAAEEDVPPPGNLRANGISLDPEQRQQQDQRDLTFFFACWYKCPANSYYITSWFRKCPTSFDHCACNRGYVKEHGRCVVPCHPITCPPNSIGHAEDGCLDTNAECFCIGGFVKSGDVCVPICKPIECPANSHPAATDGCTDKIDECECEDGYYLEDGECRPTCNPIICPLNSYKDSSDGCVDDLEECTCNDDFVKSADGTTCEPICHPITCPVNSHERPLDGCLDSPDECICNDGFVKDDDDTCVFECAPITCPAYSYAAAADGCADTLAECKCIDGYEWKDGRCVVKPPPPGPCGLDKVELIDLNDGVIRLLKHDVVNPYPLDRTDRFTILATTFGTVRKVTFTYPQRTHVESNAPWYMSGEDPNGRPNFNPWLWEAGHKTVKIVGCGDNTCAVICFDKTFLLEASFVVPGPV